jgi:outer membrane protein assembly factor BamA
MLSAVRAGVVYDTLDRPDAPLRGTQVGSAIEVADRWLGSDLQFIKTDAWIQHHQPIGPLTLHASASFSTIGAPGGPPRSERLFLTSASEIRGYQPETFGPVGALGTPIGGEAKLLARAELEVPLVRRIGLSAIGFADAGGLYGGGQGQTGLSVGFGLLWRSPIGALRFSWALPVDGAHPAFVFGIGSSF